MKRMTTIATAALVATLSAGYAATASAQDFNTQEKTFLTFSGAVELPGVTLPAGTYVFRLADTPSRNVVQVLSEDGMDIKGQWTFVQANRIETSDDNVVLFKEQREGATPAVQFWYYPGERIGKEFIYPKDQAQRIADRTGGSVLSDEGRVSSNSTAASTDSQGNVTPWPRDGAPQQSSTQGQAVQGEGVPDETRTQAAAPAVRETEAQPTASATATPRDRDIADTPAPATTARADQQAGTPRTIDRQDAQPVGTSGVQTESSQTRAELPATASPLAFTALLGLLSLAGALGIRGIRQ
jgi:hypothetical protein